MRKVKLCCFYLFLIESLVIVNADYKMDYENAMAELNESFLEQKLLEPKGITDVPSFFYDLALYKYALKGKHDFLKRQCKSCFQRLTDISLITDICAAVQCVFGDESDSQHLSLYALKGFRTEIRIILYFLKKLLKYPDFSETLGKIYENYSRDLCLELSY